VSIQYLKNPHVTINSVDLSAYVTEIAITYEAKDIDSTAGNAAGAESHMPGLLKWSADITFNQDYAASQVDATLFPLVGAAAFAVLIRPSTAARGAANPEYTGNAILTNYNPLGGKVGDLITTKPKLVGSGALSRSVAG
jgi:hypothetical protein